MNELKACPFCGENFAYDFSGNVYCTGTCRDNGHIVKVPVGAWQSRPTEDLLKARITKFEAALDEIRKQCLYGNVSPDSIMELVPQEIIHET